MTTDQTAPARLTTGPHDRRALVVMTVAHGIQHFYVAGLAVTYPFVVADLHVSYAVLGAVLTVAGVSGGLLQGAAGLLRNARARAVLGAQNTGLAASALLGAVAPGFGVFAGARVLGALVSWPQHPVGSAYLSDRFPQRRGTVLSWHTAGGSIGTVTVPLVATAVIATAGWRWALVVIGAFLGVGAVMVRLALPPERHRDLAGDAGAVKVPLRELLRRPGVAAVLAASTIAAGGRGLGTLSTYVPADLRSHLGLPAVTVGAVFTVMMVASVAGPVLGGNLADRMGRRRTLVVTYFTAAGALVAFGFSGRGLSVLIPVSLLVGLLAYSESPLLQAVFSDLVGAGVARSAFGIFFAIAYGVGALWTALLGWIITVAGFPAAFCTMAGSFVVAGAIIAVCLRPGPHS
ncbi:MAG TPA: MFS transporter [Acidimicrobiales bacterium]|nr:MFS transporter [Acidimicrobiales bacterium]